MVTRLESLSSAASAASSPSAGRTTGGFGMSQLAAFKSVFFKAMSPGITPTATPRSATATRMAFSRMRAICSGFETSST